jgi:putative signal transducing protein
MKWREPTGASWVKLATFYSGLDVDITRARLEAEGIPVLVRGNHVGSFGPSFWGGVPGGVEMYVPSPKLARARDLLDDPA